MTRGQVVAIGLAAWVVILGIAFQPHAPRKPSVTHARHLDLPDRNLPTLAPARP